MVPAPLTWQTMNFLIFILVLSVITGNSLKDFFKIRSREIKTNIDEALRKKGGALKHLNQSETLLKNLHLEITKLKNEIQHEGEMERDIIIHRAEYAAQKIKDDAKSMMEHMTKNAYQELQNNIVKLAAEDARLVIKKNITTEDHNRLIVNFIKRCKDLMTAQV